MTNWSLIYPRLGKLLAKKRTKAGLSQKEVATSLNISSPQYISNIERGLAGPPIHYLKSMLKIYDMDKKELIAVLLLGMEKELQRKL